MTLAGDDSFSLIPRLYLTLTSENWLGILKKFLRSLYHLFKISFARNTVIKNRRRTQNTSFLGLFWWPKLLAAAAALRHPLTRWRAVKTTFITSDKHTGSFLIPVAKYLPIAPKSRDPASFQAHGQLHRCGPFDILSYRFVIVSSLGPHRDVTKLKYFALNQGQKIHVLSSQCSCISGFNIRDLRMISSDPACSSDSKTPLKNENIQFQSWENCIWTQ